MSDNENQRPEGKPRAILNIPAGNSPITPDPTAELPPDERRTGNLLQDSWTAIKVVDLAIPNADSTEDQACGGLKEPWHYPVCS